MVNAPPHQPFQEDNKMKKSIVALLLVFSLIFGFSACRKSEKKNNGTPETETQIESEVFIVGEDGSEIDVQAFVNAEGETEYFYVGENGEEITVAADKVVVETKKVVVEKTTAIPLTQKDGSVSPELQSLYNLFNDPDSIADVAGETEPAPTFKFGEKTLNADRFKPTQVATTIVQVTNEEGKTNKVVQPVHNGGASGGASGGNSVADISKLLEGSQYQVVVNIKTNIDGEETAIPLTMSRYNDKFYMDVSMPIEGKKSVKASYLIADGKANLLVPSMKCYITIPSDEVDDFFAQEVFNSKNADDAKYKSSQELEQNGQKYVCDIYTNSNNDEIRYIYLNNEIKRIEVISEDSKDTTIMEVLLATKSVDLSKFKIPMNYIDMTNLLTIDEALGENGK